MSTGYSDPPQSKLSIEWIKKNIYRPGRQSECLVMVSSSTDPQGPYLLIRPGGGIYLMYTLAHACPTFTSVVGYRYSAVHLHGSQMFSFLHQKRNTHTSTQIKWLYIRMSRRCPLCFVVAIAIIISMFN